MTVILLRSLANLIAHKRSYCCHHYRKVRVQTVEYISFPFTTQFINQSKIKNRKVRYVHISFLISPVSYLLLHISCLWSDISGLI